MRNGVAAALWILGAMGTAQAQKPVITVATDGKGQFASVQAAVNAAGDKGAVIRIAPGHYQEKLRIEKNGIELRGTGSGPEDVVLEWDDTAKIAGGTTKSAAVSVIGDDFYAENLTIADLFEKEHPDSPQGGQAVALLISGDREVMRHVRLLGYQDTLYANSKSCHANYEPGSPNQPSACHASRQLFEDCYVAGHVDYIFGDAKAVFKNCELHAMSHGVVTITAQSRLYPAEDSGYLFIDCTISAEKGVHALSLGRPWRAYARTYFVNTTVKKGASVDESGWMEWDHKLATSDYAEYNTHDENGRPVSVGGRSPFSHQLTKTDADKLSVSAWLAGPDGWDPENVK